MLNKLPNQPINFLCVGVEPSLISFLLTNDQIDISLDICKTMLDANRKMEHSSYHVYLIDFSLSGIAVEFVQNIRSKQGKQCFIVAILDSFEQENFFWFKSTFKQVPSGVVSLLQPTFRFF